MAELRAAGFIQDGLRDFCYTPSFLKTFLDGVLAFTDSQLQINHLHFSVKPMASLPLPAAQTVFLESPTNEKDHDPDGLMMPSADLQYHGVWSAPPVALYPKFARVVGRCKEAAAEIRRIITACNEGGAPPEPLPALLCGSLSRGLEHEEKNSGYFASLVFVEPGEGTFVFFFDVHFKPQIFLLCGDPEIVGKIYPQFLMAHAFVFNYSRV